MGRVVRAVEAAAEGLGVRMRTHRAVATVDNDGRAVHLSDGSVVRASAVIVAVTPKAASRLLPELVGPATAATPIPTACLDLALSSLPNSSVGFGLGLHRPTYFSAHTRCADLAPGEGALVHLAVYRSASDSAKISAQVPGVQRACPLRDELEDLADQLQPGWRDRLVHARFLPALHASSWLPTVLSGGMKGRPSSNIPGVTGVYLAGDWVGPLGHLAEASASSAVEASRLALEHSRIGELAA